MTTGRFLPAVPILPSLHFPFPSLPSRNADLAFFLFSHKSGGGEEASHSRREKRTSLKVICSRTSPLSSRDKCGYCLSLVTHALCALCWPVAFNSKFLCGRTAGLLTSFDRISKHNSRFYVYFHARVYDSRGIYHLIPAVN